MHAVIFEESQIRRRIVNLLFLQDWVHAYDDYVFAFF